VNILLINYEYPPIGAGGANACKYLAESLHLLGHNVCVLTSAFGRNQGKTGENGVTIYRIPAFRRRPNQSNILEMLSFTASALVSIGSIIKREAIDHQIVFFSLPCGPIGFYAKLRWRIPYIISLRGGDVPGTEPSLSLIHCLLAPLRRTILGNAQAIAANSRGLKDLSEKADPFKVAVIPNGVDIDFFSPATDREARPSPVFKFLFAGRFQEQKGLFFLIRAFSEAVTKMLKPMELHMVGDGPLAEKLKQQAKELGISEKVIWHGWLDKDGLRNCYRACDCLVNPSLYEGMPNTVLEAMACGLPVIASNVAGNQDVVMNEKNGYLYPVNSCDDLVIHMSRLGMDYSGIALMQTASRKEAEQHYSWKAVTENYLILLESPTHAV
jgi:glycosyltransferase involved in cell wall biosynthesis